MGAKKKTPVDNAMERALAALAERALVAETQIKVLAAELSYTQNMLDSAKENNANLDLANKQWWVVFWGTFGATPEQLLKYRIEMCRETKEEAERLVYNTSGYYEAPYEGGPRTAAIIVEDAPTGTRYYFQFHALKRPE